MFDLLYLLWSILLVLLSSDTKPVPTDWTEYGVWGDYIGGVWGTLISAGALIFLAATWRSTKKADVRSSIMTVLAEMLKTHDAIVAQSPNLSAIALREFSALYKFVIVKAERATDWGALERVDICYTMVFYGPSTHSVHALARYGPTHVKAVQDPLHRLTQRGGSRFKELFKGNQGALSHYMRNLFGMYTLIDDSDLSYNDKQRLAKIVRTKLSNYDQALLALNILSHLGQEWIRTGICNRYRPIANVPKHFFGYDDKLKLKLYFPLIDFEWEKRASQSALTP